MRKTPSALSVVLSALFLLSIAGPAAQGQERGRFGEPQRGNEHPNGIIQDWSTKHVVFPRVGPIQSLIAVQNDPRAILSWQNSIRQDWNRGNRWRFPHRALNTIHRDWAISLGGGSTAQSMFPAKFTFDPTATPSCTADFIVFPVNVAGSTTQPNIVAFNQLYSGTTPTGLCSSRTPLATADTLSDAATFWSYNITAAGGQVPTSPALSLDGTKVAFVESASATTAHFHVLAWKSGDGFDAANAQNVLTPKSITSGFSAVAPAAASGTVTDLALGSTSDTISSPYVDLANDVAYVGNDAGVLFRIKNVFCTLAACTPGTSPAPVLDASWGTAGALTIGGTCTGRVTGPVVDPSTLHVFVGCADGKLYGFTSAGVALANSPVTVGTGTGIGVIADPPLLDAVNGFVYEESALASGGTEVVVQAKIADLSGAVTATLATGNFQIHSPAFNDAYFTSGTSSQWLLYEVAPDSVAGGIKLWGIGFSGTHAMNSGTPTDVDAFAVGGAFEISPLTEFLTTGGEDRLFESFLNSTGDLASFNISNGAFPASLESSNSASVGTGTTGIVVDNAASATAQADSIYFGALTANNAVKLTQSGLN